MGAPWPRRLEQLGFGLSSLGLGQHGQLFFDDRMRPRIDL
jgi:hypothetical protein